MNLGKSYNGDVDTDFEQRVPGYFGRDARIGMPGIADVLRGQHSEFSVAQSGARGNHQRAVRSLEGFAKGLDHAAVLLAVLDKAREVMVESRVDDRVRICRAQTQALWLFQRSPINFNARRFKRLCASIRAGQT